MSPATTSQRSSVPPQPRLGYSIVPHRVPVGAAVRVSSIVHGSLSQLFFPTPTQGPMHG
jgi:hypothetical protein